MGGAETDRSVNETETGTERDRERQRERKVGPERGRNWGSEKERERG